MIESYIRRTEVQFKCAGADNQEQSIQYHVNRKPGFLAAASTNAGFAVLVIYNLANTVPIEGRVQ